MVHGGYGVFLGLDVGKGEYHAVGLAPDGQRLHDAPLPNTALICLTRRRIDVLHAMLRTKSTYRSATDEQSQVA